MDKCILFSGTRLVTHRDSIVVISDSCEVAMVKCRTKKTSMHENREEEKKKDQKI